LKKPYKLVYGFKNRHIGIQEEGDRQRTRVSERTRERERDRERGRERERITHIKTDKQKGKLEGTER
jgi:hypothetical protein